MDDKLQRKFERNMAMSGNGRLIQPNAMSIETTYAPGSLAQPAVVTMQGPGAVKVLTIGGLTKVEALAGQIAAGAVGTQCGDDIPPAIHQQALVMVCVDTAEAILAECERRGRVVQDVGVTDLAKPDKSKGSI